MTKKTTLPAVLMLCVLPFGSSAQDCSIPFIVPLFDVQVESGVVYGSGPRYNGGTAELALNLYKPVGDGQTERPLVVVIHGGGFSEGNRNEMNDLCETLAGAGWAAATISYRLGFYGNGILEAPWAYDPAEVTRAWYRAMQDAKGAIRFLKDRHEQDSTSTTNVFVVGFSAGAITALNVGFLDSAEQKPSACGSIGDVQHFFNFYPRPDLGGVDGTLNQGEHDATVRGVVSIFGGLSDTAWVHTEGPALYTYHQLNDPVVACGHNRPYHGIGLGIPDNYPYLYGSCSIDQRMQHLNPAPGEYLYHPYNGNEHDIHDPVGVLLETMEWMHDLFCSITTDVGGATPLPSLMIHPNPADDALRISGLTKPLPYTLHDATGRMARTGQVGVDGIITTTDLPQGLYLLRLADGAHATQHRVLVAH